jgi:hypothetical protein
MNLFKYKLDNETYRVVSEETDDLLGFFNFWKDVYPMFTDPEDDYIYYYILDSLKSNTEIEKAISIMGAWKTASIKTTRKENSEPDLECPGGAKYFFNDKWKSGTTSAYDIWTKLPEDFNEHKKRILFEPEKLVHELITRDYNRGIKKPVKTKFGIYAFTYIHFLEPEKYPIYDRFARQALDYIFSDLPIRPVKIPTAPTSFREYEKNFHKKYNNLQNYLKNEDKLSERDVDKALFSFGHFLSDGYKEYEGKLRDFLCREKNNFKNV